jgi:hypothetical protein
MNWLLAWVQGHEALAAWVQALGSILALAVAIGVPAWQRHIEHRDREAERKLRARSLAIVLYPEVAGAVARLNVAVDRLHVAEKVKTGEYFDMAGQNEMFVGVPMVLRDAIEHLYLLDAVGDGLMQLMVTLDELYQSVSEAVGRAHSGQVLFFVEEAPALARLAEPILAAAELTRDALALIREGRAG